MLIVWNVFQSSGIDYRLVAIGSLLPLLVDLPVGHPAVGHTLVASVVLLAVVMVGTIGRSRLLRRRLLCLPIGSLCGLVLSGAWTNSDVFWWPLGGSSFAPGRLVPMWGVVVLMEIVGLVACWWIVGRFGLYEGEAFREFLRSGRLKVAEQ
ncbi:MAG: hypothetical protein U0V73_15415 [Acidimicrobiia bacterium]